MRTLAAAALGALAAGGASAVIAAASGGPPPPPQPAPAVETVVAHGSASARVKRPARRTDKTIERAVQSARRAAFPKAVANARAEAEALARAAGLRLGEPLGVARDVAPLGYWEPDAGRFGPGRWCGPITSWRTVTAGDGTRDRVRSSRRACPVPRDQSVRLTVTFGLRPS